MTDIVERLRSLGDKSSIPQKLTRLPRATVAALQADLRTAADEIERLRTRLEQCKFLLTMLHPDHHGEMTNAEIASLFGATLNMLEERTSE